jgi:hypothetical protein
MKFKIQDGLVNNGFGVVDAPRVETLAAFIYGRVLPHRHVAVQI